MKIALIHDWLTGMRGGEKCLEALCEVYPEADIFTLIHVPGSVSPTIEEHRITPTALQRLPGVFRWYRFCLPAMPTAIETFDLSAYDLVISSSHCVAKGALTRPETLHLCYVHTPMRYAWDLWPQYFSNRRPAYRLMIAPLLNYLRTWDAVSANRVDRFVANSRFVARRIRKYYGRDSTLVHPPVDTRFFEPLGDRREFYLMVAAMVPYKGVDLAVEAFNELGRPLKIVGDGYLRKRLTAKAGPNVEFTGRISDEELRRCYQNCRAVIQPGAEDFGIVPLEAQSSGRPVIALGRAGALDTVHPLNRRESFLAAPSAGDRVPAPTGVFFYEYNAQALRAAVRYFEENERVFRPELLRANALRFDREIFKQKMQSLVARSLAERVEASAKRPRPAAVSRRRRA